MHSLTFKYIDVILTPVRANLRANAFTPYLLTSANSATGHMPMEAHLVECPGTERLMQLGGDNELMTFDYAIVKSESGEVGVTVRAQADPKQVATFDLVNNNREQLRLCRDAVVHHGGFKGTRMRILIRPAVLADRKKYPKCVFLSQPFTPKTKSMRSAAEGGARGVGARAGGGETSGGDGGEEGDSASQDDDDDDDDELDSDDEAEEIRGEYGEEGEEDEEMRGGRRDATPRGAALYGRGPRMVDNGQVDDDEFEEAQSPAALLLSCANSAHGSGASVVQSPAVRKLVATEMAGGAASPSEVSGGEGPAAQSAPEAPAPTRAGGRPARENAGKRPRHLDDDTFDGSYGGRGGGGQSGGQSVSAAAAATTPPNGGSVLGGGKRAKLNGGGSGGGNGGGSNGGGNGGEASGGFSGGMGSFRQNAAALSAAAALAQASERAGESVASKMRAQEVATAVTAVRHIRSRSAALQGFWQGGDGARWRGVTIEGGELHLDLTECDALSVIDQKTFYNCSRLVSIALPPALRAISDGAFWGCTALGGLSLPAGLQTIGKDCFQGCRALASFDISHTRVTTIDNGAFQMCEGLRSIQLPMGLENVLTLSFQRCAALERIDLSKTKVVSLGGGAFSQCTSLIEILLPPSVGSIGWMAFGGCSSLPSIDLKHTRVVDLTKEAFKDCTSLVTISFPPSLIAIGQDAFSGCDSLSEDAQRAIAEVAKRRKYNPAANLVDAPALGASLPSLSVGLPPLARPNPSSETA